MPHNNDIFKLTQKFDEVNIDDLNIQDAPKFLLRSMKNIKKDKNGHFKYHDLVKFMINNHTNKKYYQGRGIKSIKNIYLYWNYAKTHRTAYIPRFETYFTQVV
jgi:hypothetical protein